MDRLPSVGLVLTTLAIAIGLGAVNARLTPSRELLGDPAPSRLPMDGTQGRASDAALDLAQPPLLPLGSETKSAPAGVPHVSATGQWISPLYPQNGVTLWDRIRSGAMRDRRAFLFGVAIQVHAPAVAATPGLRIALLPCCPR